MGPAEASSARDDREDDEGSEEEVVKERRGDAADRTPIGDNGSVLSWTLVSISISSQLSIPLGDEEAYVPEVAVVVVVLVEDDVVEDADKGVSRVVAEAAAKASIETKGVVVVLVKVKVEEVSASAEELVGSEREVAVDGEKVGCVLSTVGSVEFELERVVAVESVVAVVLLFLRALSLLLVRALV